ncbi:hypothetical protein T484DRAFT_3393407 [Baffinella frigidus]|nr:hypothetical protein T484DRAFT_3393407 [Cryptophyta sp. CCMP2293]
MRGADAGCLAINYQSLTPTHALACQAVPVLAVCGRSRELRRTLRHGACIDVLLPPSHQGKHGPGASPADFPRPPRPHRRIRAGGRDRGDQAQPAQQRLYRRPDPNRQGRVRGLGRLQAFGEGADGDCAAGHDVQGAEVQRLRDALHAALPRPYGLVVHGHGAALHQRLHASQGHRRAHAVRCFAATRGPGPSSYDAVKTEEPAPRVDLANEAGNSAPTSGRATQEQSRLYKRYVET